MFIMFLPTLNNNNEFVIEWNLLNYGPIMFSIPLIFDKIRIIFSLTVLLISIRVILFASSYISNDKYLEYFIIMVIIFIISMNCLIFFPSLVMLLLGWDGLGLSSYLLVIYYINEKSLSAGILTALTNRIGDAFLIIAVSWSINAGHWYFFLNRFNINILIMIIILGAAITKSAQIPFSAWLPAAIAAPTPVSALVHSSTLVTAGIYLIIRYFPSLRIFFIFKIISFYIGALTCIIARIAAIRENDLKKIIALSTLRQLGIIIIALGLEQPLLAFFHLITHALFKALLFICAGTIIHINNNNQDIRLMGNLSAISPITITTLNSANLALCGIPFLAGFYSKDRIVETFFITNSPIRTRIIIIIRICLTASYSIRLSVISLWIPLKSVNLTQYCSKVTYLSYLILTIGALIGGATLNWIITPIIFTPTIPPIIKIITLILIILFARTAYTRIKFNYKISYFGCSSTFNNSIWFLTFISSRPLNKNTIFIRHTYIYNEITWIEKLRGKGVIETIKITLPSLQKINNLNLSYTISSFRIILFLIILRRIICYNCH